MPIFNSPFNISDSPSNSPNFAAWHINTCKHL
jgi:hypothetical protein